MTRPVVLFVKSEQRYPDAAPDCAELMTEGTMTDAGDGAVILEYRETELTGMEGTTTWFTVRPDEVELRRSGTVTTGILFRPGRTHRSLYETPWGSMTIDVATRSAACRLSDRGGVLELRYTISVDHRLVSDNTVKIRIREKITRETI